MSTCSLSPMSFFFEFRCQEIFSVAHAYRNVETVTPSPSTGAKSTRKARCIARVVESNKGMEDDEELEKKVVEGNAILIVRWSAHVRDHLDGADLHGPLALQHSSTNDLTHTDANRSSIVRNQQYNRMNDCLHNLTRTGSGNLTFLPVSFFGKVRSRETVNVFPKLLSASRTGFEGLLAERGIDYPCSHRNSVKSWICKRGNIPTS